MLVHLRVRFLLRLSEFMLLNDDHLPTPLPSMGQLLLDNLLSAAYVAARYLQKIVLLIDSLKAIHHESFLRCTVIFIE